MSLYAFSPDCKCISKVCFFLCVHREPYDPKPILGAALTLVGGHSAQMDVVEIELDNKVNIFSIFLFSYNKLCR